MRLRSRKGKKGSRFRIFFATDVHGSDRCFRKFLAAAKAYEAQAIILGGDVGGKGIVPFVEQPSGEHAYVIHGEHQTVAADSLEEVEARVALTGLYPRVCSPDEAEHLADDAEARRAAFEDLITEQLAGWCELAESRLGEEVRCIITPGNDDPLAIDAVLEAAPRIECPEREVLKVGPFNLASLGNTNRTPWNTDREFDEETLTEQIDQMLEGYPQDEPLVFNFHVPPYDTGLDTAAELDDDLRPVIRHGSPSEIPVGSTAVREAIDRYQPVVGLHGHIHESAGVAQLGASTCFNPGSEYSSGVLRGLIVDFEADGTLAAYLMTSG